MADKLPAALKRLRHDRAGEPFDLARVDPAAKPFSTGDKRKDKAAVEALAVELDRLQDVLFASRTRKLLVILQGMDASGKDGTLRSVFNRMSPLGVRTVGWRAPNEEERAHDFLWRIHRQLPAAGEVVVFNRSHYEDVLVPVANGSVSGHQLQERYAQINDFERMLCETGTAVAKFMLHISKDEQRVRLQERIDDPTKRWKFQRGDLEVRNLWDVYQHAYAQAISMTGTKWAPWTVVPADSKTHRNLMVATLLKRLILGMNLRYPDDPTIASIRVE